MRPYPARTPNGLNAVARRGLTRQIEAHARSAERSVVDLRDERASDVRIEVPVRSRRSRHFKPFGVLGSCLHRSDGCELAFAHFHLSIEPWRVASNSLEANLVDIAVEKISIGNSESAVNIGTDHNRPS
jgi:hypothetical protein